jgi:hypothetical protein
VNTFTGNTTINAGTLTLTGSGSVAASPILHVGTGATLDVTGLTGGANFDGVRFQLAPNQTVRGGGTIQGAMSAPATSTISPGTPSTPGSLQVNGDLVMFPNSTFVAKLNGNVPATGHDQLQVNGTLTLVNPALNVAIGGGFTPSGSDKLFILVKNGVDPIVGQFNNVPEGSVVNLGGGFSAQVSYLGDSTTGSLTGGNDVVVYNFTPAPEPATVLGLSAVGLGFVRTVRRRLSCTPSTVAA